MNQREARIKQEFERDIESGNIVLPSIVPGFAKPDFAQVTEIRQDKDFYNFLPNLEQARPYLEKALQAFTQFQDYLSSKFLDKPEIQIQLPQTEKDLLTPKLDSLCFDERVIVKPLKTLGKTNKVNGIAQYGPVVLNFDLTRDSYVFSNASRTYGVNPGCPLRVDRFPILLATEADNLNTLASFSFEVLCQQLEPKTSLRIAYKLQQEAPNGTSPRNYVHDLTQRGALEERLVAEAILKSWLLKTRKQFGLDLDTILKYSPASKDCPNINQTQLLAAVQRIGLEKTISFYGSKQWSLPTFLDKDYSRWIRDNAPSAKEGGN